MCYAFLLLSTVKTDRLIFFFMFSYLTTAVLIALT